jgi:hypothetical protein
MPSFSLLIIDAADTAPPPLLMPPLSPLFTPSDCHFFHFSLTPLIDAFLHYCHYFIVMFCCLPLLLSIFSFTPTCRRRHISFAITLPRHAFRCRCRFSPFFIAVFDTPFVAAFVAAAMPPLMPPRHDDCFAIFAATPLPPPLCRLPFHYATPPLTFSLLFSMLPLFSPPPPARHCRHFQRRTPLFQRHAADDAIIFYAITRY